MDRYGLQTAVKHAVDFSAPKACALFPDVATDDLLRLGVLKMAKQDARKFKKKLDAGDFGSLPPGLVDSVQLEKGGTDDESTMTAGADRDRLGRGAVAHRGRRRRRAVDLRALHVRRQSAVLPLLRDVRRGTRRLDALSCVKIQS